MSKQKRIIICPRCNRERYHCAKGFCQSCYSYLKSKENIIHCTICDRDRQFGAKGPICNCCSARIYKEKQPPEFWEKHAARERERRRNNREAYNANERERNKRRKEQRTVYNIQYANKNREKLNANNRAYRKKNPTKVNHYKTKHLLLKANNIYTLTEEEWEQIKQEHDNRCHYCHRIPEKLNREHKNPLSLGGHTTAANIVPACPNCNSRKINKPYDVFIQQILSGRWPGKYDEFHLSKAYQAINKTE